MSIKIINILEHDVTKVENWFKKMEPVTINAIQQSYKISSAFLAWAKTDKAVAIEEIIAKVIPEGQVWTGEAINIATAMAKDMAAASYPASWRGIALRLLAEIFNLITGGTHPQGIDGILKEAQDIFVA